MMKELIIKDKIASKRGVIVCVVLLVFVNGGIFMCADYINQLHLFLIILLDFISIILFVKHHRIWNKYRFTSNGLYQETHRWFNKEPFDSRLLFQWRDVKKIEISAGQLTRIDPSYLFVTIQCGNPQKRICFNMEKYEGLEGNEMYNCNQKVIDYLTHIKEEMPHIVLSSK